MNASLSKPLPESDLQDGFNDLDRQFAHLLLELAITPSRSLALAGALTSLRRSEGHTCLDLATSAGRDLQSLLSEGSTPGPSERLPELAEWTGILRASGMVGTPGEFKPLILDGSNRLYLHRYWKHEQTLAALLRDQIHRRPGLSIPVPKLREILDRLFPPSGAGPDDQKLAAWMAATRPLTVITGGPGTGKTRTVVWMLAALLEARGTEPLEIAICAPTGKAASRIAESILKAQAELPCSDAVKARLPRTATTLHRLLGTIPFSPRFRRDAANPLTADLVVVDGGKGQLAQAKAIFDELGIQGVDLVGLAKARTESDFRSKEVESSMERIFIPNRVNPIPLYPHTRAYKLLTHIRDEAHRFAITFHRSLRDQKSLGKRK